MRLTIAQAVSALLVLGLAGCSPATQPGEPPIPRDLQVFQDQASFDNAVSALGARIVIDFEDLDARPVNNTITGRNPFPRLHYAGRGVFFSNPRNYSFYVAPGGLFWNPTNSLSVGRFPFDSGSEGPEDAADDLVVNLEPGCLAAAFSVLDKGDIFFDFVRFFDHRDRLLRLVGFPRSFLGMVAPISPSLEVYRIHRIEISEAADDGDDVVYDNFICIR